MVKIFDPEFCEVRRLLRNEQEMLQAIQYQESFLWDPISTPSLQNLALQTLKDILKDGMEAPRMPRVIAAVHDAEWAWVLRGSEAGE